MSLIVAHCNTEVFQAFLDTMADEIPAEQGIQIHLVLDNAGWHKTASLNWHYIKPVYLRPTVPTSIRSNASGSISRARPWPVI